MTSKIKTSILELTYDYIIVGAGIAGLYTAYRLNENYPEAKICIIEASKYIGGRLHTIHYDNLHFEGGGARFNTEQLRIQSLVKELKLVKYPITNTINYIPIKPKYDKSLETVFPNINDFIIYMKKYIKKNNITEETLINTTIIDFASRYFSKEYPTIKQYLIDIYPYYSELVVLNALEGINLFSNEFSSKMQYYVLDKGMQEITDKLYTMLKSSSNITINKETPLDIITKEIQDSRYIYKITSGDKDNKDNTYKIFKAKNLILAIPKPKLLQLKYLTKHKDLLKNINSIQTEPLYRIYARYPLNPKTGKVWFDGLEKIGTNLPIKYIIPVSSEKGLIMISYTDSKFATYWLNKVLDGTFEKTLNKQLKLLFPDAEIPKAKWYKHCHWVVGAGYWKPHFNRKKIIPEMIKPIEGENIFICGENYSSHQAWVEGSLETSELVLEKLGININKKYNVKTTMKNSRKNSRKTKNNSKYTKKSTNKKIIQHSTGGGAIQKTKKSKQYKKYTLEEVAKHKTKNDAWIVIEGKVANITKWIPKHPGGDIIMKGVGKDATSLFKSIGHDEYAKKMLKKYQIGII